MRLERLVAQREEIEEQSERLDAMGTLIRRENISKQSSSGTTGVGGLLHYLGSFSDAPMGC